MELKTVTELDDIRGDFTRQIPTLDENRDIDLSFSDNFTTAPEITYGSLLVRIGPRKDGRYTCAYLDYGQAVALLQGLREAVEAFSGIPSADKGPGAALPKLDDIILPAEMKWEVVVSTPTEVLADLVQGFIGFPPFWGAEGGKDGFTNAYRCHTEQAADALLNRIMEKFPEKAYEGGPALVDVDVEYVQED